MFYALGIFFFQALAPHFDANRSAQIEDANRGGQTLATLCACRLIVLCPYVQNFCPILFITKPRAFACVHSLTDINRTSDRILASMHLHSTVCIFACKERKSVASILHEM
jgi:hypothetical protein